MRPPETWGILMQRGVGDTYAQDPGIEPFAAEPPAISATSPTRTPNQ